MRLFRSSLTPEWLREAFSFVLGMLPRIRGKSLLKAMGLVAAGGAGVYFAPDAWRSYIATTMNREDGPAAAAFALSEEAPTGFDLLTNGFTTQEQMDSDREVFGRADEHGDNFNHLTCVACHFNPADGGSAPGIAELRVGRFANGVFSAGRLVHLAANPGVQQERIAPTDNVRVRRRSRSIFGAAFVECISNATLQANTAASVLGGVRGQLTIVPVTESPGQFRIGRFGWKSQHGSLLSFTFDASQNEIGEDNPIDSEDILAETRFQRSLKAPPRGPPVAPADESAGSVLFDQIGCAVCHTRTFRTAPAGTVINGGAFTVPVALGDKVIHPFSDFALWDIGTGDGVVHDGQPQNTRHKVQTKSLWGFGREPLRFHDGRAITVNETILAHGGAAVGVTANYRRLTAAQQNQIVAFLLSL